MSNKVITMQLVRTLIQSLEKGFSIRHISRELKLSRKTVTLYAAHLKNSDYSLTELRQLDDSLLASLVNGSKDTSRSSQEDTRKAYFISCMHTVPGLLCSGYENI